MDQAVLVDAIGDHLDSLTQIVNWTALISIAMCWAGIRREREIEAMGLKVDRKYAFYAMATVYSFANLTSFLMFLRLRHLLLLVDDKHFLEAFTTLSTYPWVLNPFSYYGSTSEAHILSSEGVGLLIVVWWLCNSSLYTLLEKQTNNTIFLLILFLGIGLAALVTIEQTNILIANRMSRLDLQVALDIRRLAPWRYAGNALGILAGILLYQAASRLQRRGSFRPDALTHSPANAALKT